MIRHAAETSAEDAAWATFDHAMLRLHGMYTDPGRNTGEQRRAQAEEVAIAWARFRDLYAPEPFDPRPAA